MPSAGQDCIENAALKSIRSQTARRLMLAASASALSLAAPQIMLAPAHAQALPGGCTDAATAGTPNDNDGVFDTGETITCLSPPDPIAGIDTSVEDLTIVIGNASTPTNVNTGAPPAAAYGVRLLNGGSVEIVGADSEASGTLAGVRIANSSSDVDDITLTSEGTVSASTSSGYAVFIDNDGTGSIDVDVVDVAADAIAIDVYNSPNSQDITVTSTGRITSADNIGVAAENLGTGGTTLNVNEIDAGGDAISAIVADTAGDLTISATGAVEGGVDGVDIRADALAVVDVTVVDVTGTTGDGINIDADVSGGFTPGTDNISVTSTGTITGGRHGVFLDVYRADYPGTTLNLTNVNAGTGDGVYVRNDYQSDTLSITVTGDIVAGDDGIDVFDINSYDDDLSISVNNVYGGDNGIEIDGRHVGGTVITSTGLIEGGSRGIEMIDSVRFGDVTIEVLDVTGGDIGVYAASRKSDFSFTAAGTVTGTAGDGIFVDRSSSDGETTMLTLADVVAGADGVEVTHNAGGGSGALSIVSTGTITAGANGMLVANGGRGSAALTAYTITASGDGINVTNGATATDLTIIGSAGGLIHGGAHGVRAFNYGDGATTVSVASVTAGGGNGIGVRAGSATTDLTVAATGAISASNRGVSVTQYGSGATTIAINGATGAAGDGVYAFMDISAVGDLDITSTGDISGGDDGIEAFHVNTGDIAIVATNVAGVNDGVYVFGDGDFNVTTTGLVSAANGDGVDVFNTASGDESVTINAAAIAAGAKGVDVTHYGGGGVSIMTSGAVRATTIGIDVYATGSDVAINAIDDVSAQTGPALEVVADNGAIDVATAGDVTSVDGDGVFLVSGGNGVLLTATGSVVGGGDGVNIINNGTGAAAVNVADVTGGASGRGVTVQMSSSGTDLSVTAAGAVSSGGIGVRAVSNGSGAVALDLADVTSDGGTGIFAISEGTDLTITASGIVHSDRDGVNAFGYGSGPTSITVDDVVSTGAAGIFALARNDLTIVSTGHIESASRGISAFTSGSGGGDMSISAVDVMSSADSGMFFLNTGGATSVAATGTVQGAGHGIQILHFGVGDVTVSANNVYALAGGDDAISVRNDAVGGALSITSTGVVTSAEDNGIDVQNYGAALTIDAAGTVTGASQGIDATHYGSGDVRVSANNVYALAGGDDAVEVYNSAAGATLSITTTGVVMSAEDDGIEANNYGAELVVSTSGGAVTGYQSGIEAYNFGSGASTIIVSNAVTGETEIGVFSVSGVGTAVTIEDGGSVAGEIAALWLDGGTMPGDPADDVLMLNAGGSISGDALLFAGDDVFNDASGQFTNVFGGDGTDTVNFAASAARTIDGSGGADDSLQEFEVFNFNGGGFTLAGEHAGLTETTFNAGANTLTGSLTSTRTMIANGATLNAGDGSMITGLLNVYGTLNIGNSPGTTTVDGDVVFGATSVLPIEIGADASDLLIATGSVALDGALEVILLGGLGVGSTTRTIIDAGTGVTGAFSSVAGDNGLLITNTVGIDEINFDVTVTTTLLPASSVGDLNENQTNVGDALIDILSEADIDPGLTDYIASVGAISDVGELGFVLGELSPEGFDAGLRFLAQSQGRFMSAVALRSPQPSQDGPYVWGAVDLSHLSKNEDAQNQGFKGDIHEFSAGVSGLGRGPVRFGVAGGYATFNGETDAGVSDEADATLYRLAASAQAPLALAGVNGRIDNVFSFAAGENELSMRVADPSSSTPILQSGEADIRSFGFASRVTATGVTGRDWSVHPHVEIGVDAIKQDAVLVGSDQPTALSVEEVNATRAHIGLGASFARRLMDRLTLRASATGVRYFGDTQNVFHARFAGAPAEASAFDILGTSVEWQARMRAGAMYEHKSGFTLSADVFGEAGDVNAYGARFELSKGF